VKKHPPLFMNKNQKWEASGNKAAILTMPPNE
jgi:hypothetical protein